MPPEAVRAFQDLMWAWGGGRLGRDPARLLTLPWSLTYRTEVYGGWRGGLGVAPLAFGPPGARLAAGQPFGRAALAWGGLGLLAWFWTAQEIRFLMPVVVLALVVAAPGAARLLAQPARWGRIVATAAVAATLLHGGYVTVASHALRLHDVLAPDVAAARRAAGIPAAAAVAYLNAAPGVGRVLLANPHLKPFYLDPPAVMVRGEYGEQPFPGVPDVATAIARLASLGVTHVLDARGPALGAPDFAVTPREGLRLVFESPDARVYRVEPGG
jgi:hypothetical protein